MYKPTIGLEIHVELKTKSKMFCSSLNDADEKRPNVNICPICLGHPGTLPVINKEAVRQVIKTGMALNCLISERSKFDRKNYFYPDLPKGYQISQYDNPLCQEGYLKVDDVDGRTIRIKRIHLEEDTGRLIHSEEDSLVDFNRAGIPLMELVTEPDLVSAKEAKDFAQELQLILRYIDVSHADMEKGQMRVEANVSLQLQENSQLGTKVEVKNLNSFRAVERAIDYEIKRQAAVLDAGQKVTQETRGWNDSEEVTFSQREKEEAHDYRYFPEPDLPELSIGWQMIDEAKKDLPELPRQRMERLTREYGLDKNKAEMFVSNKDLGEYFEKVISELDPNLPKEELQKLIRLAANYLITDLQALLDGLSVKKPAALQTAGEQFFIDPENFADFINLIYNGTISSKLAKVILFEMFQSGSDPVHIIEERGLVQIVDTSVIRDAIKEVILQNPKAVEDFKKGKEGIVQFLIGQIMAKTKGKASPQLAKNILEEELTK